MGRVVTNKTSYNYAPETTFKAQPTTDWRELEPNTVGRFGATIEKVERSPISTSRQRRKGAIVGLDSGVELEADYTRSAFRDFIEGYMFSTLTPIQGQGIFETISSVDEDTTDHYTVAANGDLDQYTLVYARGFTNSENNGLKIVASGATSTDIAVEESLTAEASPPANAEVALCGRTAAAGDLEIDANGDIISTSADFTDWGLTEGQWILLPPLGTTGAFVLTGNEGLAQITEIEANKLTLRRRTNTFQADDGTDTGSGGSTEQRYILFGQFVRNVATDHSDFIERSYHFEQVLPNLGTGGATRYRYAKGNYANELQLSMPLRDKATLSFNFVGTDTDNPTDSRATGASSAREPNSTSLVGTASNIFRLGVEGTDESGLNTDFKDCTLTIANGVSADEVLGTLGAKYMNFSNFTVNIESSGLLTTEDILSAIRNHTTIRMAAAVNNDDGGALFDVPSGTVDDGALDVTPDEAVKVSIPVTAFKDPTLGFTMGVSLFPYWPTS